MAMYVYIIKTSRHSTLAQRTTQHRAEIRAKQTTLQTILSNERNR